MTDNDIDAIRQRVNRATGGTWTLRERQSPDRRVLAVISEGEGEMTYADIAEVPLEPGDEINDWRNDAEFIAHARTDVPALLAKVDELTAALAEAREQAATAAKRIDGLRDYILGALDEDDPLTTEEMRNASIDLASALADLGHPVATEDEDEAPRRPIVTVELPAEATR